MLKTETRDIEGFQVTCTQLQVTKAYGMAAKIGKLIGAGASELKDVDMSGGFGNMDHSKLGGALNAVLDQLVQDPDIPLQLTNGCMSVVVDGRRHDLDGTEARINHVFGGNLKAYLLTLKFALEMNFSDFFGGDLPATVVKAGQEAAKALEKS